MRFSVWRFGRPGSWRIDWRSGSGKMGGRLRQGRPRTLQVRSGGGSMAETRKRSKRATKEPTGAGVCPVALCPVGMFLTVTGDVRPEAVEHLLKAGRELVLATRALLDSRVEGTEGARARLEKI